ncbi:MAG: hypothetical protein ACE5FN_01500 [Leptospirillia bacterium]
MQEKNLLNDDTPPPNLFWIKAIVAVMSVVLVAGFIGLFVMWNGKQADKKAAARTAPAMPVAVAPETLIPLPAGTRVLSVGSGERYLDVLVEHPVGTQDIYQIDRASGRVSGIVRLRPAIP